VVSAGSVSTKCHTHSHQSPEFDDTRQDEAQTAFACAGGDLSSSAIPGGVTLRRAEGEAWGIEVSPFSANPFASLSPLQVGTKSAVRLSIPYTSNSSGDLCSFRVLRVFRGKIWTLYCAVPTWFGRWTDEGPRSTATNSASGTPVRGRQDLLQIPASLAGESKS
jgi:hypothetical protein